MAELGVEAFPHFEIWTILGEARRNAISRAMVGQFERELDRVSQNADIRAVVLRGQGDKAFCAGADLKERASMSEEEVRTFLLKLRGLLRSMEQSRCIFVAYVNGAALGGGTELALACDLRVLAPHAEMGLTELKLGIIPGGGGTQRLPRLVGIGKAKELIFSARKMGAEEALAIGLANQVGSLHDCQTLVESMVCNGPIALGAAKAAINQGADLPLDAALAVEHQQYEKVLGTEDRLEGIAAFIEKRPPRFRGK